MTAKNFLFLTSLVFIAAASVSHAATTAENPCFNKKHVRYGDKKKFIYSELSNRVYALDQYDQPSQLPDQYKSLEEFIAHGRVCDSIGNDRTVSADHYELLHMIASESVANVCYSAEKSNLNYRTYKKFIYSKASQKIYKIRGNGVVAEEGKYDSLAQFIEKRHVCEDAHNGRGTNEIKKAGHEMHKRLLAAARSKDKVLESPREASEAIKAESVR